MSSSKKKQQLTACQISDFELQQEVTNVILRFASFHWHKVDDSHYELYGGFDFKHQNKTCFSLALEDSTLCLLTDAEALEHQYKNLAVARDRFESFVGLASV